MHYELSQVRPSLARHSLYSQRMDLWKEVRTWPKQVATSRRTTKQSTTCLSGASGSYNVILQHCMCCRTTARSRANTARLCQGMRSTRFSAGMRDHSTSTTPFHFWGCRIRGHGRQGPNAQLGEQDNASAVAQGLTVRFLRCYLPLRICPCGPLWRCICRLLIPILHCCASPWAVAKLHQCQPHQALSNVHGQVSLDPNGNLSDALYIQFKYVLH